LRAVSAARLDERVARGGGGEVDALAVELNALLERLARALDQARRFTADAAHELRSPLGAVMGRLEVALRHPRALGELQDEVGASLEELQRMKTLLEGLFVLAQSDAGQLRAAAEPVPLLPLVSRLVERDRPFAEERRMTLELVDGAEAAVRGDAQLLERAIGNLVDNAVAHGRAGGRVALRLRRDGARALVRVEDDGPGVPEPERARLFERFFRGDQARTRGAQAGFGLGLSIARTIVEVHGGAVGYAPRDGGGSVFTVELPAVG
jgi:signal transduction histidine kinase